MSPDELINIIENPAQHFEKWAKKAFEILFRPIIVFIICVFLIISISLGDSGILHNVMIAVLFFYLVIMFVEYVLKVNISASVYDLFSGTPTVNINIDEVDYSGNASGYNKWNKEVFNIPGDNYSYEEAKLVCKIYDSDLATYDQIEDAYNNGAEWCNNGWSAGQMTLFPTQKKTYDRLQNVVGHENDCGRPGINGGYLDDPEKKRGVNCYGVKPPMNDQSKMLMDNMTHFPQNSEDNEMKEKLDFLKTKLNNIIMSPFNVKTWNQI